MNPKNSILTKYHKKKFRIGLIIPYNKSQINQYHNIPHLYLPNTQVMETDPPENTWARPKSMSNLLRWRAKIRGPEGSPYEGGIFELSMSFPEAYPFEAPIVRFTTPLYHCNVNGLGYICVDILDEQQCWSPGLTVDKLLLSLSALLNDADPLTAYNAEAASQYLQDRERYDQIARSWTERHAMDVPWD